MSKYQPKPIDTSKIEIPQDLQALAETLARNVHETWALERLNQGWKYGAERNDAKKLHPCLVSFDELPESEKKFDHITAMETIKVILGLGYEIRKTH